MQKIKIAVIGNGMVGHHFVESLLNLSDKTAFDITIFGEEPREAYDRVHLSSFFTDHDAQRLSLVSQGFYQQHGIKLLLSDPVVSINRQKKIITSQKGETVSYDILIIATGSHPFVPPIKGSKTENCFVYRTIEDLEAIEACAEKSKKGAVIGGGLLGLEAAGALKNLGIETHVIEFSPVLMAEQLDETGGKQLQRRIEAMGVHVHTGKNTKEIIQDRTSNRKIINFADGSQLAVDFIVFSTGIRPNDALAKECGLSLGERGGIAVNDFCQTSDSAIYAIGECASWHNHIYGLVAPGYKMAAIAASHILGKKESFKGADMSAKLKLLGVDVGGIGDTHGHTEDTQSYVYLDETKALYKRLILNKDNQYLLGAVLVGDSSDYGALLQLMLNKIKLPKNPESLILPSQGSAPATAIGLDQLPDSAQICSCFDITKGKLIDAIDRGCHTVSALQAETKAGTGCGGCVPLLSQLLHEELKKKGIEIKNHLCEHFSYSRQELFHLIRVEKIKTFAALLEKHGKGYGCEICKPTIGSLLASCWNEYVLSPPLVPLQDSNDNFLANIQKDGTYSVIPRSAGGEITPEKLLVIGRIAQQFNLYTKITGSQRIGMFGAQKDDLPEIWRQLIEAGFETGHAYAKALRMAKSCVGTNWCRFGVGDSTGFGIELENRYKGIRAPHKMKIGVSGCTRECAEARSKDIGVIATEKGWNLYVGGNGGMKPRHADLLASSIDNETLMRYVDRFLMFYIRTADKATRTSAWIESLEEGIDYVKSVIVEDKLGLNQQLEDEMAQLRERVVCEWRKTVETPSAQTRFKHFINSEERDSNIEMVAERGQHRPKTVQEKRMEEKQ